jgi:hypothetical protein
VEGRAHRHGEAAAEEVVKLQEDVRRAVVEAVPPDSWLARQIEIVGRLPRWLAGSLVIGSFALGVYWVATRGAVMRAIDRAFDDTFFAALCTLVTPVLPAMALLYVIARMMKPRHRSLDGLPDARANRPRS